MLGDPANRPFHPGRVDRDQRVNRTGTDPLSRRPPSREILTGPGPASRFSNRSRAGAGRPGPPASPTLLSLQQNQALSPFYTSLRISRYKILHLAMKTLMALLMILVNQIHFLRIIQAMEEELSALEGNHTWDLISKPAEVSVIRSKWIYSVKMKSDVTLERDKA
ncbi:hypothetical protein KY284_036353 [Solanum tuberosum]|nr:hypothetical protein KY284_036353 [Solanum tuberosum]